MAYISTKEMTREDWLAGRNKYVGASEVAAILGLDKYRSPYDLWKLKVNGDKQEMTDIGEQRATAGLKAEDMISQWIGEKYGITIRKDNKIRIHPRMSFFSCNLDRVVVSHPSGPGTLELKTTSRESLKQWDINSDSPNPIFMHHWCQVQAQMCVTGYQWGAIGVMPADSFLGFGEPELIEIERDEEFIEMMEREVENFWLNHVQTQTPPPIKTVDDLRDLYPIAGPPPLEVNEEVFAQVRKLKMLKAQLKAVKDEEEALSNQLKIMLGQHDAAVFEGEEILTFRNNLETVYDFDGFKTDFPKESGECLVISKKLAEEKYPDILKKYTKKEPGARVLRLKIKLEGV